MYRLFSVIITIIFILFFNGCCNDTTKEPSKLAFQAVKVPLNNVQKLLHTSSQAMYDNKIHNLFFTKLLATSDKNNGEIFGLVKDYTDTPITFSDGSPYICNGTNGGLGSGLDYTSILQKNGKLYLVAQFECQLGAIYKAELEQNSSTGILSVKDNSLEYISQKEGFGGYVHCAGQKTPWESHLGSEEYELDAKFVQMHRDENGFTQSRYYNELAKFWQGDALKISPYYYGWTPEVMIQKNGSALYKKHYSMGRFSHELSYVMPDSKTVYMSDDGTNVGFFMYVAKNAGDLSAGTLYAAKWVQTDDADGGSADIKWMQLASATDDEIGLILDNDNNISTNDAPQFSEIFESEAFNQTTSTCPTKGFISINTSAGVECLRLIPGKEKMAAFLETRRYAAYIGATTEFRKEEGISFSPKHKKLFVGMSAITKGMQNNSSIYDLGGNNDIKLPQNPCGAVYALDIAQEQQRDTGNVFIDSQYVVKNIRSIVNGIPKTYDKKSEYYGNSCDVNGLANPDNISFLKGSDYLFIGEDTSKHLNNSVWAYNIIDKSLTRIVTAPLGAETTSLFWYEDIKGFAYMTTVIQHPLGAVEGVHADKKESFVGVLSGLKRY